mmetsp:Transcript_44631/g.103084  ORF Transcript_44631/g.103084 Transcript_44631/m.103084 type:complete len:124 (+) Transcript_44631:72-443(+)
MGCTSSASAATTKGVQLSREHQLTLEHIRAQASLRQGAKGNLGQVRVRAADTFVDEDGDDMHSMNSSPPCMEDLEFAIPLPPDVSMTRLSRHQILKRAPQKDRDSVFIVSCDFGQTKGPGGPT